MGFYQNLGAGDVDPFTTQLEEQGYLVEILHIASGKMAVFPSWITDFSDSFTSNWNSETVFGRNDPIGTFQNTSRTISVSLGIPSFSVVEARENMHQLEHLIANLYPSYRVSTAGVHAMHSSPLVKVKFANLIKNAAKLKNALNVADGGLSGWISNVNFTPNLESGMHHPSPNMSQTDLGHYNGTHAGGKQMNASHTFLPKVIDISFTLNVVHEHHLGWGESQNWLGGQSKNFPYGIETISGKQHMGLTGQETTTRTRGKQAQKFINQIFVPKGRV